MRARKIVERTKMSEEILVGPEGEANIPLVWNERLEQWAGEYLAPNRRWVHVYVTPGVVDELRRRKEAGEEPKMVWGAGLYQVPPPYIPGLFSKSKRAFSQRPIFPPLPWEEYGSTEIRLVQLQDIPEERQGERG
jgi:hypothetical protein